MLPFRNQSNWERLLRGFVCCLKLLKWWVYEQIRMTYFCNISKLQRAKSLGMSRYYLLVRRLFIMVLPACIYMLGSGSGLGCLWSVLSPLVLSEKLIMYTHYSHNLKCSMKKTERIATNVKTASIAHCNFHEQYQA